MKLKDLQDTFQRAVVVGDDAVLGLIPDGAHEPRTVMLGVYRNAYVLRLAEIVESDHELLHTYLGDDEFATMARAYIAAHPSDQPNARYFSRHVPAFLAAAEPYAAHPELRDLALLEKALSDAFDAKDGPVLAVGDLAQIDPGRWGDLVFEPHPSAARIALTTNAAAIWLALKNGEAPPDALVRENPDEVLVWRNTVTPMFRSLGAEEAMMWDEAAKGVTFGVLCEMAAAFDDPETAPVRAAGYLQGWLAGGAIAGAKLIATGRRRRHGAGGLASGAP